MKNTITNMKTTLEEINSRLGGTNKCISKLEGRRVEAFQKEQQKRKKKKEFKHCWWDCELLQSLRKTVWSLLEKFKIELLYDSTVSLLSVYPKYTKTLI